MNHTINLYIWLRVKQQLIVLFITILSVTKAQHLDSLIVSANGYAHDTLRAGLFYEQGFRYRLKNPDFSFRCARYSEAYAAQSHSPYYKAKAATLLGILFYRKGDHKRALHYHQQAIQWRQEIKDVAGIAKSELNLANVYSELKVYRQAELCYLRALQAAIDQNDSLLSDRLYLNLGVLHQEQGHFVLAEYYYIKALEQSKQNSDYEIQGSALNNLSDLSFAGNDMDKAEAYADASLVIKDLMDNEPEKADSYLCLAKIALNRNMPEEADKQLIKTLGIIQKYNYGEALEEYYNVKALWAEKVKDVYMANACYKKLLALKDSLQTKEVPVQFDESFTPVIAPVTQKSYGYFVWIFLFLLVPFAAYFIKPRQL